MDLERLNILRIELHEAKTEIQKASKELECRKMYVDALEMAILQLESIKEIEEKLSQCHEARKLDEEVIKSWKFAATEKDQMIEDLKKRTEDLAQELLRFRQGETKTG